jgi:hypothetical protein
MTLTTRKPTGLPSWPILLMAGREGTGKSWAAAEASASDLISRTLWVGIGEDAPDEYGIIPGANFEIVEHDGTYRDILRACTEIAALPVPKEGPILFVLDSGSRLWQLLSDMAQAEANARSKRKNSSFAGDAQITMDLWNVATARWNHIFDTLRAHRGPSVITARLEQVAVMDDRGQPTTAKQWKVQANKALPFDVAGIVEMQERGDFLVTKMKSARIKLEKPRQFPNFTIDALWRSLGLADTQAGPRNHDAPVVVVDAPAEPGERDWVAEAEKIASWTDGNRLVAAAIASKVPEETVAILREWRDQQPKPEAVAS